MTSELDVEWCDIPLLDRNTEEEEDQDVLKMNISNFFQKLVCFTTENLSDVYGMDNKSISTHSKLYFSTNYNSVGIKAIKTSRCLSKIFMEQERNPKKYVGGTLHVRAGIGRLTDTDTAMDQDYIDHGAVENLRFSLIEQQETAEEMTGHQMSLQSRLAPFDVKDWFLRAYCDVKSPVYHRFTEQMHNQMLSCLVHRAGELKKMGTEDSNWKSLYWFQPMFRPGGHEYKAAGNRFSDREAFPPVSVEIERPPSLLPPVEGSRADVGSTAKTVLWHLGMQERRGGRG